MTVEDMLTDSVYTFELQEELIRNSECDGWKEIPVRVEAGSDQQATDDHADSNDVSDADGKDATVAATAAAAESTQDHQSETQLSGNKVFLHYFL